MKFWSRGVRGGSAAVAIATGLSLVLAVAAPAAPPTLGLTATDALVGQPIHATAQLSESPGATGGISFEVFGPDDPTCTGPALSPAPASAPVNGEGEYASGDFTPTAAGTYRWSAHYSGDGVNLPEDSNCSATSNVGKASPGLTGSAGSATVGNAIHDVVTLSGGFAPGGNVSFAVFGPADTGCATPLESSVVAIQGSQATSADFVPQESGEFRWTATYPGDANNEAVSLPCNAPGQSSIVGKASPTLVGKGTSAASGQTITDNVTLSGAFKAGGQLVFRAFGPNDETCATVPKYEAKLAVDGNGAYSPPGFKPPVGLYRWVVDYSGDSNNLSAGLPCNSKDQSSAVGTIALTLGATATDGTVGTPVRATATIRNGAIPGGQLSFKAFPPADATCSGNPAFSSTVAVAGLGSYNSASFAPSRVGSFRWTVAYSGDANHDPAPVGCGIATSNISKASPTITGTVAPRPTVGTPFRDTVTLLGAFAPRGTVTFKIYGPVKGGCAKPAFVDTVAVAGSATVSSDPFVAKRPGRYSFVATYSGDAANQPATELCDAAGQVTVVQKRTPKLKPIAVLVAPHRISIRARLSGGASPSGMISFRLYPPGGRCKAKPVFGGVVRVSSNGSFSLAEYLATRPGTYRLAVAYSGDPRNKRYAPSCKGSQAIKIRRSR